FPQKLPIGKVYAIIDLHANTANRYNPFPERFITTVLAYLDSIPDCDGKHSCQRFFFNQCLDLLSLASPVPVLIDKRILQKEPIPLAGPLVQKFIEQECGLGNVFRQRLEDQVSSRGLGQLKACIVRATLDSPLAVLLCDVAQDCFASTETLSQLA